MILSNHFYDKLSTTKVTDDDSFSYQQRAVKVLLSNSLNIIELESSDNSMLLKGPTGSGKTIVAGVYLDSLFNNVDNVVGIWLCARPKLAEQSQRSISSLGLKTVFIDESVSNSFIPNKTVVFGNWEKISSAKGEKKLTQDGESHYSFESLVQNTKDKGHKIVLIIDEAHKNTDTKIANEIVQYINPEIIVETTATPKNKQYSYSVVMKMEDVVKSGIITKGLKINHKQMTTPDIRNYVLSESLNTLYELEQKVKETTELGFKTYQPLLLIQVPNNSQETLDEIELFYAERGLSRENRNLAVYTSKDYTDELDTISNDENIKILIFKQAISEGWDCPRASILTFVRDPRTHSLTVQTIGRIMRMVHRKHYPIELDMLNYGYIFAEDDTNTVLHNIQSELMDTVYIANSLKEDLLEGLTLNQFKKTTWKQKLSISNLRVLRAVHNVNWKELLDLNPTITWSLTQGEINSVKFDTHEAITVAKEELSADLLSKRDLVSIQTLNSKRIGLDKSIVKEIESLLLKEGIQNLEVLKTLASESNLTVILNEVNKIKQILLSSLNNEEILIDWTPAESHSISQQSALSYPFEKHLYERVSIQDGNTLEERFSKFIDSQESVIAWMKNGDSGSEHFSIAYQEGTKYREFFPDYLVETTDTVYILDTKGVGLLDKYETHLKQNSLINFVSKYQSLFEKEIIVGIVSDFNNNLNDNFFIYRNSNIIEDYNKLENWVKLIF